MFHQCHQLEDDEAMTGCQVVNAVLINLWCSAPLNTHPAPGDTPEGRHDVPGIVTQKGSAVTVDVLDGAGLKPAL
jgi:hypothetical protein